ncbi:MAG: hypothetical protein AAGA85_01345 [Bacteroidota bacterium]
MSTQSKLLATLAGFATYFLLGFLFYGVLFSGMVDTMAGSAGNVMRSDDSMVWWALIVGNIAMAYLLVHIFSKWASISTFIGGLKGGATIGLILAIAYDFTSYGTTNVLNLTGVLVDIAVMIVLMGLTGGVVGAMLGRSK